MLKKIRINADLFLLKFLTPIVASFLDGLLILLTIKKGCILIGYVKKFSIKYAEDKSKTQF